MTSDRPLDDSLSQLRAEIHAMELGDEGARERLHALMRDLESNAGDPDRTGSDEQLTETLKASIVSFEASHPRLAGLMNDVLDKLGAMGI